MVVAATPEGSPNCDNDETSCFPPHPRRFRNESTPIRDRIPLEASPRWYGPRGDAGFGWLVGWAYPCDLASLARVPFRSERGQKRVRPYGWFIDRPCGQGFGSIAAFGWPAGRCRFSGVWLVGRPQGFAPTDWFFESSPRLRVARDSRFQFHSIVQHRRRRQTVGPPGRHLKDLAPSSLDCSSR